MGSDIGVHIFCDRNKRQIRLSKEREEHLESEHPEMENQIDRIALTLLEPDRIIRSELMMRLNSAIDSLKLHR